MAETGESLPRKTSVQCLESSTKERSAGLQKDAVSKQEEVSRGRRRTVDEKAAEGRWVMWGSGVQK